MIKIFEQYKQIPGIDDYVLLEKDGYTIIYTYSDKNFNDYWNWRQLDPNGNRFTWNNITELVEYLSTQIGKVISKKDETGNVILYDYLPKKYQIMFPGNFKNQFPKFLFSNDSIKLFSKSKDDIQVVLQAKKYNL